MNKNDFMKLIQALPDSIEIAVQTCSYDGHSEVYTDQEPRIICTDTYAILTGDLDFYAQSQAVQDLSQLRVGEIVQLLRVPAKTVRL